MNGQPARFGRGLGPESLRSKTTQQADCDRDARAASNAREQFENKPSSRTAYAAIAPCWRISVHNRPSLPFATIAANGRAQTQLLGCGLRHRRGEGRAGGVQYILHLPLVCGIAIQRQIRFQSRIRIAHAFTMRCLYLKSYNFVILDFVARHRESDLTWRAFGL